MAVNLAARYVHGEWTALVTGHGTALLDPRIAEEQIQQVWAALSEGRGVSGCLEVLAADGFANLPSFALVQHGEDELRVLVRGEVEVTAGESTVGAAGIATWREALLPGQRYRVAVTGDGAAHPEWPVAGGVVLASRVEWLAAGDGAPSAAGATVAGEDGDGSGDEAGDDGDGDPEPAGAGEPAEESGSGAEPLAEEGGSDDAHVEDEADGASAEAVAGADGRTPVVAGGLAAAVAEHNAPEDDAIAVDGAGEHDDEAGDAVSDDEHLADASAEAHDVTDDVAAEVSAGAQDEPIEQVDAAEPGLDASAEAQPAESSGGEDPLSDEGALGDEEVLGDEDVFDASSLVEGAGDDVSVGTPEEPSEDHGAAELHGDEAEIGDDAAQGEPIEVSAHTAEEESAPSPEEFSDADADADADDYVIDAPTLTSSGSDIIDSLPWAVSAADREEAQAVQDQASAEPPQTPTFEEPGPAPVFEDAPADPGEPSGGSGAAEASDFIAGAEDELPEHTVISQPGGEAPAAPAQEPQPAAAAGAESDVISFDSLMAQQVPAAPPPDQGEQAGAAFSTPAAAQPGTQPYSTAAAPYGSGAAYGAPAAPQSAPPPWAPPADMAQPGPPSQGHGDVDIEGDHDGETIMVSQLPTGHGTAADPGTGESDLYDEPAPQPSMHLAMSTGAHVPLDRPVLIGRAPESARFNAGVQPRLVTVASPEQDISRTHVEVRAEGGHAVVTDLNSTNGTVVIQPGAPPRRLHPGEGASVVAGTVVDLGDGITVTVQVASQGEG